jgi:hypothetical protein
MPQLPSLQLLLAIHEDISVMASAASPLYTLKVHIYKILCFCPFPLSNIRIPPYLHTTLFKFILL